MNNDERRKRKQKAICICSRYRPLHSIYPGITSIPILPFILQTRDLLVLAVRLKQVTYCAAKAFHVSPENHSRGRLVPDQQPHLQVDVVGAFRDGPGWAKD